MSCIFFKMAGWVCQLALGDYWSWWHYSSPLYCSTYTRSRDCTYLGLIQVVPLYTHLNDVPLILMAFFQSLMRVFSPITENVLGETRRPSNSIHSWWMPGHRNRLRTNWPVRPPHVTRRRSTAGCKDRYTCDV